MQSITCPTLLLDEERCRKNIRSMAEKAAELEVRFCPHFKTHQSKQIGRWYREYDVNAITVSSIGMAEYFASDGWEEITVAVPCNVLEAAKINLLAHHIRLNLLVENPDTVLHLSRRLDNPVGVYIEIDSGQHRTGIDADDPEQVSYLLQLVKRQPNLVFKGLYSHFGHSYHAKGKREVLDIFHRGEDKLRRLKEGLKDKVDDLELRIGDTPSCSLITEMHGIDTISPGNFVFYDLTQEEIGSCDLDKIAVAMACPVIAVHPERDELVIYGGAIHFARDFLTGTEGQYFGCMVPMHTPSWSASKVCGYLTSLSQEHGIVRADPEVIAKTTVGDVISLLPIHSCMTAQAMRTYRTCQGKIVDHF